MRLPVLGAPATRAWTHRQPGQASRRTRQIRPSAFVPRARLGTVGLGFNCNPLFCACRGDADCNDMFTTSLCGRAICIDDVCYCLRA